MTKRTKNDIGKRIRRRRWNLGITQQQLAKAVDVHFTMIHEYEAGVTEVPEALLSQIGNALETPIAYFYEAEIHRPASQSGRSSEQSEEDAEQTPFAQLFSADEIASLLRRA